LEIENVDFCGERSREPGGKIGEPEEKPSKQGREPTNNSTHM
jgi:hypothetical protein